MVRARTHLITGRAAWVDGVGVMSLTEDFLVPAEVYHIYQQLITGSAGKTARVPPRARPQVIRGYAKAPGCYILNTPMASLQDKKKYYHYFIESSCSLKLEIGL